MRNIINFLNKNSFLILFFILLFNASCKNNNEENNIINTLTGHWELQNAFRDEKPAKSLDGTFFDFSSDKKMKTNLFNSGAEMEYEIKEKRIIQKGDNPMEYSIEQLSDSTLTILMKIREVPFKLELRKK